MSDLTSRLSKAVFDYLDTANLRQEPFSLPRIEEVIAGVMATDSKVPVNVVRHPGTTAPTLIDKDHADFLDSSAGTWGMGVSTTSPVTYDLSEDPDAFKKARVGDTVKVDIGTLSKPFGIMPGTWDYGGQDGGYISWTRTA
jgi:hypothetical protein